MNRYMITRRWEDFPQRPDEGAYIYSVKNAAGETVAESQDPDTALDTMAELEARE